MDLRVFSSREALIEGLAEELIADVASSARQGRDFAWVLAGGTTPRGLYERLAEPDLAGRVDWSCVDWFWGDERAVPPEHPSSNFKMAKDALLDRVLSDGGRVHRIEGERSPPEAARRYEKLLRERAAQRPGEPLFDWVLLGLGGDGHTASLFPGGGWLRLPRDRWVFADRVEDLGWRLTLAPEALALGRRLVFLVTGEEKAEALRAVLEGPVLPERWPAQALLEGPVPASFWVDAVAAALLGGASGDSHPEGESQP